MTKNNYYFVSRVVVTIVVSRSKL